MTITVNVHQAKAHFSELLQRVQTGELIIIAKAGAPIAILSPYTPAARDRTSGNDAGKVIILPEFDEPLPEFEESRRP